jgi:hypothetical protein
VATTVARLQAVLSADTDQFDRGMRGAESRMDSIGGTAKKGFGAVKYAALAAGGAIAYGLGKTAKIGFDEFLEGQRVTAQTNAVIKSTAGIANVTAGQVDKLADSLMRKSGVDDEAIKSGSNMLLTFTKIRNETGRGNDVFDRATKATLDLSVAMGKDMQSSAILVGKALNDPIKGATALSRAGVQLTQSQKDTIKAMVESGNVMGAQKIILGELTTQFGGSAEAAGKTFSGQLNILKETFSNLAGEIVSRFVPTLVRIAQFVAPLILQALDAIGKLIDMFVAPAIRRLSGAATENFGRIQQVASAVFGWLRDNVFPIIVRLKDIFIETVQRIRGVLDANGPELQRIFDRLGTAIAAIARIALPILRIAFVEVLPVVLGIAIKAIDLTTSAIEDVIRAIRWVGERAAPIFRGMGTAVETLWDVVKAPLASLINAFRTIFNWIDKVIDGIKWLINKIPSIPTIPNPFRGGDPFDPNMFLPPQGPVGRGPLDISPRLWDELAGARRFGLVLTSGYRPGAITASGTPSDHGVYPSKAIDVSGSSGAMARFFTWLIGQRDVKQAFYDPLGSIFAGVLSSYREGGHSDHVHVATYARGGLVEGEGPRGTAVPIMAHIGETILPTHRPMRTWQQRSVEIFRDIWARAFPWFPEGAARPRTYFPAPGSSESAFVGMEMAGEGGIIPVGHRRMVWPKWMSEMLFSGRAADRSAGIATLLHEWAHAFQKAKVVSSWRLSEGGATAFSRVVGPMLGLDWFTNPSLSGDPYGNAARWVMRNMGIPWVLGGQFADRIKTADSGFLNLRPGWNMVGNFTGRNEPMRSGGNTYITITAPLGYQRDMERWLRDIVRSAGHNGIIIDQPQPGF